MTHRLQDRVALITGGASGMGASHARAFVAEGARVVIADVDMRGADELATELGERATAFELDVTDAEQWAAAVAFAEAHFGRLDVLVNNAGILHSAPLTETTDEQWELVMTVNATSVFFGMRAAVPALARAGNASIVNISSTAGIRGIPAMHAYTASKFAVTGLTKSAALELSGSGIRVNSVHPGSIRTPMTAALSAETPTSPSDDLLTRQADPAEVSRLVVYLASDESSFSTGAEFVVDGGISAGLTI